MAAVKLNEIFHDRPQLIHEPNRILGVHDGVMLTQKYHDRDAKVLDFADVDLGWRDLSVDPLIHHRPIIKLLEFFGRVHLRPVPLVIVRGLRRVVAEVEAQLLDVDWFDTCGRNEANVE